VLFLKSFLDKKPFKFFTKPMESIENRYSKHFTTFFAGQINDLDIIVSTIAGITNLLNKRGKTDDEEKALLKIIKEGSEHIMELLNEQLQAGGQHNFLKKRCDMLSLLQSCINIMQLNAAKKRQYIVLNAEKITLDVNKIRIWAVLNNLLENAIKYSPEGEKITVDLQAIPQKGIVQIRVADNGIGMKESMKNKMFGVNKPRKLAINNLSYDLATSYQVIEAHNGRLWFESEDKEGTIFYIELPLGG